MDRWFPFDLSRLFDNDGISYRHDRGDGSFNVWGNTFPAEHLPPSGALVWVGGVPFVFPPKEDGQANNMTCAGQLVEVPREEYRAMYVLGASERRSEDPLHFHFADGPVEPEWLRLSDFWPETPARFGELEAFRCPVMHYPRHTQSNMAPVIWRQHVPVPEHGPLAAISFPDNIAMHLFAITLRRAARARG